MLAQIDNISKTLNICYLYINFGVIHYPIVQRYIYTINSQEGTLQYQGPNFWKSYQKVNSFEPFHFFCATFLLERNCGVRFQYSIFIESLQGSTMLPAPVLKLPLNPLDGLDMGKGALIFIFFFSPHIPN